MARDVMAVRLHLPQIRVLEVLEDTPGALVVSVESTLLRLRCAQCGFKCRRVHDRRAKKIRDLEVSGRRTLLVWVSPRIVETSSMRRRYVTHTTQVRLGVQGRRCADRPGDAKAGR